MEAEREIASNPKLSEKKKDEVKPGFLTRLRKVKHIEMIVAGVAVVIMFAIYFGSKGGGSPGTTPAAAEDENYCVRIERELADMLSTLDGAGNVKVLIAWESSVESVIAYITNSGQNSVSQSPQIISGNGMQSPVVLKEIYPKATGIVILSQGASNAKIKLDIISAVSTLLSVTPDKIQVLTMK